MLETRETGKPVKSLSIAATHTRLGGPQMSDPRQQKSYLKFEISGTRKVCRTGKASFLITPAHPMLVVKNAVEG